MTKLSLLFPALLLVQITARTQTPPPKNDAERLREAIEAVDRAVENRKTAENENSQNDQTKPDFEERAAEAAKRLISAKKGEGREEDMQAILRDAKSRLQGNTSPETDSPSVAAASGTKPPRRENSGAPNKPPAASPNNAASAKAGPRPGNMVITADEKGIYSRDGVAIFTVNVAVNRSDLKIWCDRLEVALDQPKDAAESNAPPDPDKPPEPKTEGPAPLKQENVKTAIATSKDGLVLIWRKTDSDEILATCREALYDGKTGNITLKNRPEVLKGLTTHILGRDETSEMILFKSGDMTMPRRPETSFNLSPPEGREIRRRLLGHMPPKPAPSGTKPPDPSGNPPSGEKPSPTVPPGGSSVPDQSTQ
ncbi:MAG: LptA/OstA family protein [Verrucomicrobiales bacterium]